MVLEAHRWVISEVVVTAIDGVEEGEVMPRAYR